MRRQLQSILVLAAILVPMTASGTRSMSISSTSDNGITKFFYGGTDSKVQDMRAYVTITNTGDEALNVGDEDYNFVISYYYSYYNEWGTPTPTYEYGPFPIPESLAVGESKTFLYTVPSFNGAELYTSSYGSAKRWNIKETVSGKSTQFAGSNITIMPKTNMTQVSCPSNTLYYGEDYKLYNQTVNLQLRNNTKEDLTVGDQGYSVTLRWHKSSSSYDNPDETLTLGTFAVPIDCPSESSISFDVVIPEIDVKPLLEMFGEGTTTATRTVLRGTENISYTKSHTMKDVLPCMAEHTLVTESGNSLLFPDGSNKVKSFGFISEDQILTFRMRSVGGAPVHVTSIDVPEGVIITPTEFTLPGLASVPADDDCYKTLTMTVSAETPQVIDGLVTIHIENADDDTFGVKAIVPDPSKLFEDFEMPEGESTATYLPSRWITAEGSAKWEAEDISSFSSGGYKMQTNDNDRYAMHQPSAENQQKLVTPRLRVDAGATMAFDAMPCDKNSVLSVWYSADRTNWIQAANIRHIEETESTADWAWVFSTNSSDDFVPERGSYTLDNIPEGEWYIAFQAGNCYLNNVYGFALASTPHDIILNSASMPETAPINYGYTATLSAVNVADANEAENSYSVKLYCNDKEVAAAETPEWAVNEQKEFNLTFYPHEMGTHTLYAEIKAGDVVIKTDEATVTFTEEPSVKEITIGTYQRTSSNVPHYFNYTSSESQFIANADYLQSYGLEPGCKITGIKFPSYTTHDYTSRGRYKVAMKSVNLTSLTTDNMSELVFDDGDVKFMDDNYNFVYSSASSFTNPICIAAASFSEPYEYDGGNIAIWSQVIRDSEWKSATNFATDEVTNSCICRYKDTNGGAGEWDANYDVLASKAWENSSNVFPIFVLAVELDPAHLVGTLYGGDGNPIPNQEIVLTSSNGQAQYKGTTDENGKYDILVYQAQWEYGASVDNPDNKWYYTCTEFSFTPGETNNTDIHLEGFSNSRDYCISITAVPDNGVSLEGKSFSLTSDRMEETYPAEETVFDSNGKCVLFVYGGRHTADLDIDGFKPLSVKFHVNTEYNAVHNIEEIIVKPFNIASEIIDTHSGTFDITFTWNRQSGNDDPIGESASSAIASIREIGYVLNYSVSLDDNEPTTVTEPTYLAEGVTEGDHTFSVIANYFTGVSEAAVYVLNNLATGISAADITPAIVKVQGLKRAIGIEASADADINITDASGRVLATKSITAGNHTFNAAAGLYIVTVGTTSVKVVVK
ncbi:MAG: T9SS type A sorting domain-containing protein [Prevotella sp.]